MDWLKKHADTVVVIGSILSAMLWMNGKFNNIEHRLTIIETVLMVKNIMPKELCKNSDIKD